MLTPLPLEPINCIYLLNTTADPSKKYTDLRVLPTTICCQLSIDGRVESDEIIWVIHRKYF